MFCLTLMMLTSLIYIIIAILYLVCQRRTRTGRDAGDRSDISPQTTTTTTATTPSSKQGLRGNGRPEINRGNKKSRAFLRQMGEEDSVLHICTLNTSLKLGDFALWSLANRRTCEVLVDTSFPLTRYVTLLQSVASNLANKLSFPLSVTSLCIFLHCTHNMSDCFGMYKAPNSADRADSTDSAGVVITYTLFENRSAVDSLEPI